MDTPLSFYRTSAIRGVRRHLSRLDRRPWSETYGCFDRDYWMYKTLSDFPRMDFQQALWGLSILHRASFEGNPFAGRPFVLEWVRAAIEFWARHQNTDGSVDEWFAGERSFCASAFTAAAVGEGLQLLAAAGAPCPAGEKALERAGRWLALRPNPPVGNQGAARLLAVESWARTRTSREGTGAYERLLGAFLKTQTDEGWFPEYGGADVGYGLLTLDLLGLLFQRTRDARLTEPIGRLVGFLSHFFSADGAVQGEIGSRETRHGFPFGLEFAALEGDPGAGRLIGAFRSSLRGGEVPSIDTVDDAYSAYFYTTSFCAVAALDSLTEPVGDPPDCEIFLETAGLYVQRTANRHLVINARKGVWGGRDRGGGRWGDAGYVARVGSSVSASGLDTGDAHWTLTRPGPGRVEMVVEKSFGKWDGSLPLRRWFLAFHVFSRFLKQCEALSGFFVRWVKKRKISERQPVAHKIRRVWTLSGQDLGVADELCLAGEPTALWRAADGIGRHSPSSQFFTNDQARLSASLLPEGAAAPRDFQFTSRFAW